MVLNLPKFLLSFPLNQTTGSKLEMHSFSDASSIPTPPPNKSVSQNTYFLLYKTTSCSSSFFNLRYVSAKAGFMKKNKYPPNIFKCQSYQKKALIPSKYYGTIT